MAGLGDHNLALQAERSYELKGDYESLLFEGVWYGSRELFERSRRLAGGIAGLGVEPGERVVVTMGNSPRSGSPIRRCGARARSSRPRTSCCRPRTSGTWSPTRRHRR